MKKFSLSSNYVRQYKNNGQHCEQWYRFTMTGEYHKADNVSHDNGTDYGNAQIKSARATICKGLDLMGYLATDKATVFVYVTADGIAYEMSKAEYIAFCETFGTVTRESQKNGGTVKIRLKHETTALIQYLNERA